MFSAELIGSRLRDLRQKNQCKQDEIARGLGASQSIVSSQERGTTVPTPQALYWYAQRYNVSVDYILGLIDDPAPLDKERAAPQEAGRPDAPVTVEMVPELLKSSQEFQRFVADLVRQELSGAKNQP